MDQNTLQNKLNKINKSKTEPIKTTETITSKPITSTTQKIETTSITPPTETAPTIQTTPATEIEKIRVGIYCEKALYQKAIKLSYKLALNDKIEKAGFSHLVIFAIEELLNTNKNINNQ